ncbi:MAG: hypothetical protein RL293_2014 [Bacteroidota bacterium]|jgi:hypothetical protein
MNCKIHIYLLNDLYSQELADEQHEGNQSIDNIKYEWEDELSISSDVISVTELSDVAYPLAGMNEHNEAFQFDIPNMRLFEIQSSDAPKVYIGASESIVSSASFEKTDESYTIEIFLKDYEPMSNPTPGIFIAAKSFPKELIRL